ncbi:hypothetical protein Cgig2_026568 [Carnegiea gigantea]|uniref:Uncharacterized protein n=1 Tax=Carnegiea gigantea TaxID=171969 RepID=A0A9Q1JZ98_9CARY|nr:hypothetical protein Cgig2_026568 [Carnegiea gigantea]
MIRYKDRILNDMLDFCSAPPDMNPSTRPIKILEIALKEVVVAYKGQKLKIGKFDPDEMLALDLVARTKVYIREKGLEPRKFSCFYYQKPAEGKKKYEINSDEDMVRWLDLWVDENVVFIVMIDKRTPNKRCSLALGSDKQQRTLEAEEIDVTKENIHVNSSDFAGSDDDVVVEVSPIRVVGAVVDVKRDEEAIITMEEIDSFILSQPAVDVDEQS